jgi:hypothetical protein
MGAFRGVQRLEGFRIFYDLFLLVIDSNRFVTVDLGDFRSTKIKQGQPSTTPRFYLLRIKCGNFPSKLIRPD